LFVEKRLAGLIVGGVNQNAFAGLHTEAEAALGMVQRHGAQGAVLHGHLAFSDVVEVAVRRHLPHVHGEIRLVHLLFQHTLQAAGAAGGVKEKPVLGVIVKRGEEGDALDVVPVKVGDEDVGRDAGTGVVAQPFAQIAQAGAAVEDVEAVGDPHLDAGGVTSVTHVFRLRSRGRPPHSPKSD
jgi:hypothetical protein